MSLMRFPVYAYNSRDAEGEPVLVIHDEHGGTVQLDWDTAHELARCIAERDKNGRICPSQ